MQEELLNIVTASRFLGVKESWLRKKVFKKEIQVIKLGRLVRIRRTDLEKLIREGLSSSAKEVK